MNTTMTNVPETPVSRVEVITSVQRRRRWTAAEKVRLVEEASQPGMSLSFVARRARDRALSAFRLEAPHGRRRSGRRGGG